jgi:hypothetical protein
LPVNVKEKLEDNVQQITELVNKNFTIESSDFQTTMLLRNQQATESAHRYLNIFMQKLMRLLDERGIYMEYKRTDIEMGHEIKVSE